MGAFDKIKDKAKDLAESSGDKIAAGVDKATDFIDDKTKGKFHDKLEKVDGLAQKLDKTDDGVADEAGEDAAEGSTED
ncbi:MAG: antitoxin [Acidimicrobiales bacterium]|nr:antitoxin [Acidimicrobiales bacterium]